MDRTNINLTDERPTGCSLAAADICSNDNDGAEATIRHLYRRPAEVFLVTASAT